MILFLFVVDSVVQLIVPCCWTTWRIHSTTSRSVVNALDC